MYIISLFIVCIHDCKTGLKKEAHFKIASWISYINKTFYSSLILLVETIWIFNIAFGLSFQQQFDWRLYSLRHLKYLRDFLIPARRPKVSPLAYMYFSLTTSWAFIADLIKVYSQLHQGLYILWHYDTTSHDGDFIVLLNFFVSIDIAEYHHSSMIKVSSL